MNIEVLVGAEEFWNSLEADIVRAKQQVYVQTMTFEGDSVGKKLSASLLQSEALDRRLLIDDYSNYVVNDTFIYQPSTLFNKSLLNEIKETTNTVKKIKASDVLVKFTNPINFWFLRYPLRNHKKLMIIDQNICYIGGINFSEHNFQWNDMMLRYESSKLVSALRKDFIRTWEGENSSLKKTIEDCDLFLCNGRRSSSIYEELYDLIATAKDSIYVHSPYVTFPLMEHLKKAANSGVTVTFLTPENNNKPLLKHYLLHETSHSNFNLRLLPGVNSHLKALLIDDACLVSGSSNFDFVSYYCEQEIIIATRNRKAIGTFKNRILNSDLARSNPLDTPPSSIKGVFSKQLLKLAEIGCRLI